MAHYVSIGMREMCYKPKVKDPICYLKVGWGDICIGEGGQAHSKSLRASHGQLLQAKPRVKE